jgi:hypothetical protein
LIFGRRIIALLETDVFWMIVSGLIIVALAGTAYSGYRVLQSTRKHRAGRRSPKTSAA